jgi:peptidoglycan/LPS O-acetylase OafA/YrhL
MKCSFGGLVPKVFLSIQGLRGIAALLVVVHHYNGTYETIHRLVGGDTPWLTSYGHLRIFGAVGVPIFFVISGFVIGMQRFEPGFAGVYDFMAKRVARIVPLYWTMTLIFACVAAWTPAQLVRSLLFIEGPTDGGFPVLGPGWSLEYEMFFYVCFAAFVVSGLAPSKRAGIGALIAVFALLVLAEMAAGFSALGFFGPIILEFCGGLVIASVVQNRKVTGPWFLYLLMGVVVLAVSATPLVAQYTVIRSMWGVGAFFLVLGLVSGEMRGWVFMRSMAFQQLGNASYAIYLSHVVHSFTLFRWPIWYWRWYKVIEPHLGLAMMVACAAVCGLFLHFCYEVRINAYLRRLLLLSPPALAVNLAGANVAMPADR